MGVTKAFNQFNLGDEGSLEKTITKEMVQSFADLSGDYNPVHMDEDYCVQHGLEKRVVHGMLILSFLSTLIGVHLPGAGALWMSQAIDFIAPVHIGDTIRVHGTVVDKLNQNALGLEILVIKIDIKNQDGKKVARGTVRVSLK